MRAQGWWRDPFGRHDDRWFSDGRPTRLVRDQGIESYDEPPPLIPVIAPPPTGVTLPYPPAPPAPASNQESPAASDWGWWVIASALWVALMLSFGFLLLH